LSPCLPAGAFVVRPRRTFRRRVAATRSAGAFLPVIAVLVVLTASVSFWLSWRISGTERDIAAGRARIAALTAERDSLAGELGLLGGRKRVERIAAARGLFPPAAAQKIRLRLIR